MATYFHGTPAEIQSDGLQTLYLMNPGYVGYSADPPSAAAPSNMLLLNSAAANSLTPASLGLNPLPSHQQQQQHFVGIPLQAPSVPHHAQDPHRPSPIDVSALHGAVPRLQYNLWTPTPTNNGSSVDVTAQMGLRRSMPTQQGLSLSLSPQQPPNYTPYRPEPNYTHYRPEHEIQLAAAAPAISPGRGEEVRISGSPSSASGVSNGILGLQSMLMGSKYLKAAQQLLDEVVNVGKGIKDNSAKAGKSPAKASKEAGGDTTGGGETSSNRGAELTTAERQELQMKKAKLVSMLDEVEQRYRQYHHQMQIVVTSFEAATGFGSARMYTALALETISSQFRCLRDAISGQIRATSKSLGEEDCLAGGSKSEGGGSRLRFVDHHLRQQRALQQLGMIQHNAWRPQRGLPERSVSVLRAWLFEHFLHPYPKDSDKHMLAKQTGLTRSQVSNWFINARVRLWKPMVEEMYLEETKEQEHLNNGGDKTSKSEVNEDSVSKSSAPQESGSPTRTEQTDQSLMTKQDIPSEFPKPSPVMIPHSSVSSMGGRVIQLMQATYDDDDDDDMIVQDKLKKARSDEPLHPTMTHSMEMGMDMKSAHDTNSRELFFMKFGDGRQGVEDIGYSFMTGATNHGGGGFGPAYPMGGGGIGRFDPEQFAPRTFPGNGGVSLTLALPHCESLSLSGTQQPSYLSGESIRFGRRLGMTSTETTDYSSLEGNNNNPPSVAHSSNAFDNINIQNRKRFANHLLPDFVA